jgi:hypothetical protein
MKVAYSQNKEIAGAVTALKNELSPSKKDLVLYFASSNYNPAVLASTMNAEMGATSVGCTTSGELISGKMLDDSIVAMCLDNEVIEDFGVALVENLSVGLNSKIDEAFSSFEKHFGCSMSEMNYEDYVGMILSDGLSNKEEVVIDAIGNKTNVLFVGGSAGDDLKFKNTHIYHNEAVATHASVLVLLKPKNGFEILKTQSFKPTGKSLTVTKAIEDERRVKELNGMPATQAYAEQLGCEESELSSTAFHSPLGIMISDTEPFVRSPRVMEDQDVLFYCSIKEGQELDVLESTDIIDETASALKTKFQESGTPACIINFNCILRKLELIETKKDQAYADLFKDIPTIGFHTYGESYIGHINQTATMLLLK